MFYFPLYNGAELEVIREVEYDKVSKSVLALRRKAWGYVPRSVFFGKQSAVKDAILRALDSADIAILQRAQTEIACSMSRPIDEGPHSLFLLHANRETLQSGSVSFRSEAIGLRVLRTLATRQFSALLLSMQQLLESRTTKGLAGNLFEILVTDSLKHGGSFAVRRLDVTSTASQPTVMRDFNHAALSVPFDTLDMIAKGCQGNVWALETHRFVPASSNFASIDSVEVGLRLVQITTKHANHGLKVTSGRSANEGLAAIAEALLPHMGPSRWGGETAFLDVYFVVPEGSGAAFGLQKLEFFGESSKPNNNIGSSTVPAAPDSDDSRDKSSITPPRAVRVPNKPSSFRIANGSKPVTAEVRQFVLEMPLSALRVTGDVTLPRDAIDEAGES
jgi:hypothetical protein